MKSLRMLAQGMLAMVAGALILVACNKDNDDVDNDYTISGNASGSQEVPSFATTATGSLNGTYNAETNLLTYSITWTGVSGNLTMAHFHGPALVGVNAGVIHDINIVNNGTSGTAAGTITIHDTTEAHLLAGKIYYNLHTALKPSGEIRGQVTATQ